MIHNVFFNTLEKKLALIVVLCISFFYLLPYIIFGQNSIITIHDNLDGIIPYYKMHHDNGLFFRFDVPSKGFSEMSIVYYPLVGFHFQSILYLLFSDFVAFTLSYYFSFLFSSISMYILLKKVLRFSSTLSIFTAICYAILPVVPVWNISVSTLPLIIAIFIHFASRNDNAFSWKTLLLLFFPFFSFFASVGIFVLGFWFLGLVILGIKNKKININLLVGFIVLCIGYVLADLQNFYLMFVLKTPLNRHAFAMHPSDKLAQIKIFMNTFYTHIGHGYYHATSFQQKIIIPTAFLVSVFCLTIFFRKIKEQSGIITTRIKKATAETDFMIKLLFLLEFIIFIFSCITALYTSGLLNGFIIKYIPLLDGFDWGRVFIFNRVLWPIIFAICLQIILKINLDHLFIKKTKNPHFLFCVGLLIFCQVAYTALSPVYYNDQIKTWFNEIIIKTNIAKKIRPNTNFDKFISYREFFAKDFFEKIKKDISYSDERVVAFGYHPSVLMYNGFNTIDGYNSVYPLSYMKQFRALIAPELEVNQLAREYYDSWGGRMYLYNSDLSFEPTRNKNTLPIKLNIDMEVFRNDFDGKYILSRAEISNSDILGLDLVNRYYDEKSIYTIFLYKTAEKIYEKGSKL